MVKWLFSNWSSVIQSIAALFSLAVIWVYSHKNTLIVRRQKELAEEDQRHKLEHDEMMKRKVASVLVKRLSKISAALDGIGSKQAASMFAMDSMEKGLPNEFIVTYLDATLTFRVFNLFDQLRDDHVNVSGVLEQLGDAKTVDFFAEMATARREEVNALLFDLASISDVVILQEET